ncbi:MAG: hypothetical protein HS111_21095 [Kofleriaceae bacterium]|nr:hypothetical protein [Kofleriaceae bacterium]MCL4223226.1 hypothetical protein [Myxococcales bacterium]
MIADEVDRSLIREMLRLTPDQRLEQNDRMLRMIEELRVGLRAQEPAVGAGRR